ncbi:HAD family hydrolase [Pontibacter sp. G13]|uniref:HAD family hydrolase n=1 Tax=Pontibacter sp. G13 TaxID=3074898 RepID=UPI00288AA9CC|nr:HAD family hydrolase [Pontibacter sp. G13]WNJ20091.1 HAD family hydrolase [Pontibacter sp. G13]
MSISFDLDGLLIAYREEFPVEPLTRLRRFVCLERLRAGTIALFRRLQHQGHTIGIYTTSLRSEGRIRWIFACHGLSLGRVVNGSQSQRMLRNQRVHASKYPPAFGFLFHIDDSKGVAQEAMTWTFKALIIAPDNSDWTEQVWQFVQSVS